MVKMLASGVVTDQIFGGFSLAATPNSSCEFALVYAPKLA